LTEQAYQAAEATIHDLLTDLGYDANNVDFSRSTEVLPPDDSCGVAS
jgi:hypothetical protein